MIISEYLIEEYKKYYDDNIACKGISAISYNVGAMDAVKEILIHLCNIDVNVIEKEVVFFRPFAKISIKE